MKPLNFIFLLGILGFFVKSLGQVGGVAKEKIFVHTDREIYLAGEMMWFSLYCLEPTSNQLSDISAIAYIELLDRDAKPVLQQKLRLQDGLGNGQLLLPADLGSGSYYLRAYTNWMKNFDPARIYEEVIYIVNAARPPTFISQHEDANRKQPRFEGKKNEHKLTLSLTQAEFGRRDKIDLRIQHSLDREELLSLSLSVYKVDPVLRLETKFIGEASPQQQVESTELRISFPPEMQAPSIHGKFIAEDPDKNPEELFLSFPGESVALYTLPLDENQAFHVEVSPSLSGRNMLVWGLDDQLSRNQIEIESPFLDLALQQKAVSFLSEAWRPLLDSYLFNVQVAYGYGAAEWIQQVDHPGHGNGNLFYDEADFSYKLDDYTRFPSLDEVFLEYVGKAHKRKVKGKKQIFLWDEYANTFTISNSVVFENPALLMIDGVPVADPDIFWDFDVLKVEYLDLVTKRFHAGPHLFDGLVHLRTYEYDFGGKSLPDFMVNMPFTPITVPVDFPRPQYATLAQKESRIPDFRTTLHWEPRVNMEGSEKLISFFSSDDTGTYRIVVNGVSAAGKLLYGETSFQVKGNQ